MCQGVGDNMTRYIVLALIIFTGLLGCTTTTRTTNSDANSTQSILKNIDPGDRVIIETLQGKKHELVVQSISVQSIHGNQIEIPIEEIKSIEKEKASIGKTLTLIEVGLYVVTLYAFVLLGGGGI
jgi:preprotein translocase subunit YajC